MAKRDKALFKSLCLGKCKSRDLPTKLNLSGITPEMNQLWEASIREIKFGIVREHAALLVWERESLRLTNIVEGADAEVEPNYQLAKGQQLVGTFHTHPYVTGMMGVPFSGIDIASVIADEENISILHSGNRIFALARTEATPRAVNAQAVVERAKTLVRIYLRTLSFPDAALQMNTVLCEQYNLGFYWGESGKKLNLTIRP